MQVLVEIENRELYDASTPTVECITKTPKKRKKVCREQHYRSMKPSDFSFVFLSHLTQDAPSPIALEPCNGNRAAVLSLLVRLPTGKYKSLL